MGICTAYIDKIRINLQITYIKKFLNFQGRQNFMNKYKTYNTKIMTKKITVLTILIANLIFNLAVNADESSLNIEEKKALKEAKIILFNRYPKLTPDQLRFYTMETNYSGYLNKQISSVTFMNIDAKQKIKEINGQKKISFLMFELFLVKLPTKTNVTGSVEIFKDTYHGTKSEFDELFR